jgi:hypothetical protein
MYMELSYTHIIGGEWRTDWRQETFANILEGIVIPAFLDDSCSLA